MSARIKVAIGGINGRLGRASAKVLLSSGEFELVGAFGKEGAPYVGTDIGQLLGGPSTGSVVSANFDSMISQVKPDVILENSVSEQSVKIAKKALELGIRPVVGTSGIAEADLESIGELARKKKIGALVIPNFSVGAVLMMEFARQAGEFFTNVEIVEMHHTKKLDAPSGTAMHTVKKLAGARDLYNEKEVEEHELLEGSRGGIGQSGVRVHSLRLPGLISHQEVIFGSPGELLTIRHDSFNMDCFLNGILMSLRYVNKIDHLVLGLDNVLGLAAARECSSAAR